jgi:hypothetical protein
MIKSYEEADALMQKAFAEGRIMGDEINVSVRFDLGAKMVKIGQQNNDPAIERAGWNTIEDIISKLRKKDPA